MSNRFDFVLNPTSDNERHADRSLTRWIAVGIFAGALTGLFLGEYTGAIKWVGDAYVGLLQMAVLPYVAVSLITNIGRLSVKAGIRLLKISVGVLLILWLVGMVTLTLMTQAFPHWETGSFFSSQFTEEPPSPDWLDLFIPSNPFRSFAQNSIPAVVVFCIGIGVALMRRPNKMRLLEPLQVMVDTLADLNKLIVRLTPLGMFAIVAHTAGTIDFVEFQLVQGYLLTYGLAALALTCLVLPLLVSSLTPLSYREVLRASRDPLVASFVIGNSFVVLPMVIEALRKMCEEHDLDKLPEEHKQEYLVPLAYPFPDIGRIVGIVFLPFAAWFYGMTIDTDTYPTLLGVGFLGAFAKPVITIPLLLDVAELPSDIFNLFLASGVVAARFGDLMKTMHLISFTILTICILNKKVSLEPGKLIAGTASSLVVLGLVVFGIRGYLDARFKDIYSKERLVTQRDMLFPENTNVADIIPTVLRESSPNPHGIRPGQSRISRIKQLSKLRVGFNPDRMPFCYFRNESRVLIGFDVQMAYYLADDLGVGLEFVPIEQGRLQEQLNEDHFDVAMSALEGSMEQATLVPTMQSYMDLTLAIVVPDHDKSNFRSVDALLKVPDLKIAVVKHSFFADRAKRVLPEDAELVELNSAEEYFTDRYRDVSGLVISAESGSAWTMRYPQFTVANPAKGRIRVPLYYLSSDPEFETFLHNWLTLKRSTGTFEELYDYWILGLNVESKRRRWSVLRNVLGWDG